MISNKMIGLAALVFVCGSAGFSAVGCSSTVNADDDDDDAGKSSSGANNTSSGANSSSGKVSSSSSSGHAQPSSSGTVGDGGDAPACYDGTAANTRVGTGPAAHQNKCSDAQLQAFLATCLTSGSDDAGTADAGDAADPCTLFIDANKDCAVCILPEIAVTSQAEFDAAAFGVLSLDGQQVSLDIASCVAGIAATDDACKKSFVERVFCAQQTCTTCDTTSSNDCLDFGLSADSTDCETAAPVSVDCNTAINAVTSDAVTAACGDTQNGTFEDLYLKVGHTRCGQ